jgi:hypothetical protein
MAQVTGIHGVRSGLVWQVAAFIRAKQSTDSTVSVRPNSLGLSSDLTRALPGKRLVEKSSAPDSIPAHGPDDGGR